MMSYLTADALKARLRGCAAAVKLGGDRTELLRRCHEHGLVTVYEQLATRNCRATRTAWLNHELALAGCELRSDSRLCEDYIRDGCGNPREIAGVMAEMKFYYEHTEYEAIKDELHETAEEVYRDEMDEYERDRDEFGYADRDFRPRFRDHYCSEEASASAKRAALEAWVRDEAGGTLETACQHPMLPPTIKRSMLECVADRRFNAWVGAWVGANGWNAKVASKVVAETVYFVRPVLRAESICMVDLTDDNFEVWFGDRTRAWADVVGARTNVVRFIDQTIVAKGLCLRADRIQEIKQIASWVLRVGLTSDRIIQAIKDAAAEHLAVPPSVKPITYAETLDRMFGRKRDTIAGSERQRIVGRWRCIRCQYAGSGDGVWQHCQTRHGVRMIRDAEAILEPAYSASESILTSEAFRVLVLRAIRKHGAARSIQTHWRIAISCPDFYVCKRRLLKEAGELSGGAPPDGAVGGAPPDGAVPESL